MSRVTTLCALALVAGGCSTSDPEVEPVTGTSYSLTTTLDPGTEVEHCRFVTAPPEGLLVNHDVVVYTEGSHHFLFYTVPYDTIPTEKLDGTPIEFLDEEQGVFDCSEGVQAAFEVSNLIGGSQNGDGDALVDLPDGVAIRIEPNAVMLMNAHYINPTGEVLQPTVNVTLETIDEGDLQEEGGMLFWYNPFIKVPAMGSSHRTARCDVPHDISISNTQSHMHARGVDYQARILADSGAAMLYESSSWENVPVVKHEGDGLDVSAGSTIEWTCFYENPDAQDIYQGPKTTNEMCMVIASYYPAEAQLNNCAGEAEDPQATNFLGAEWIGQGDASCADSLTCFQSSIGGGGSMFDTLARIGECVNGADPAVSKEFSAVIGCTLSQFRLGNNAFEICTPEFAVCSAK